MGVAVNSQNVHHLLFILLHFAESSVSCRTHSLVCVCSRTFVKFAQGFLGGEKKKKGELLDIRNARHGAKHNRELVRRLRSYTQHSTVTVCIKAHLCLWHSPPLTVAMLDSTAFWQKVASVGRPVCSCGIFSARCTKSKDDQVKYDHFHVCNI